MKFGLRKLILSVAAVALILTALMYCTPPRIQWQQYDADKVKQSIDAGENVLVYFRGSAKNSQHRDCNPENMLSYMPLIEVVQSNQVRCFLGEAWEQNSAAQQEVIRLTGEVPEFQLAAYAHGQRQPTLIDGSSSFVTPPLHLEMIFGDRGHLLP